MRSLLMTCILLAGCAAAPKAVEHSAPTAQAPIKPSKIILIGDSTVAVQGGWGGSFCSEHVTSSAACLNLARGGRSSGSYIAEGSWNVALAEARSPGYVHTWVLMQFGHNDQPGKPGRSTDLATEFPANLRRYVNETRAAGATPVFITSLTRRMFTNGVLQNDLRPWAESTIGIATEMNVPLVDLNALSSADAQRMGAVEAARFAPRKPTREVLAAAATGTTIPAATEVNDRPPPAAVPGMAEPKLSFDYTHLGRVGADYYAAMVTAELARQIPEMRPLLIP